MENKTPKYTAVILAAGSGQRMGSDRKKQFMLLDGMPMVVYSLLAFEASPQISSIVLVTAAEDGEFCRELCREYRITKLHAVAEGGNARFRSVFSGLQAVEPDTNYVLIHDGARPLLTTIMIERMCEAVKLSRACIAAVPAKDTIKVGNPAGVCIQTPDRRSLWQAQTPQAFSYPLILSAYRALFRTIESYHPDESVITDDSVIVENMTDVRVHLVPGEYSNLKVTTPEDMIMAQALIIARKAAVRKALDTLGEARRQAGLRKTGDNIETEKTAAEAKTDPAAEVKTDPAAEVKTDPAAEAKTDPAAENETEA